MKKTTFASLAFERKKKQMRRGAPPGWDGEGRALGSVSGRRPEAGNHGVPAGGCKILYILNVDLRDLKIPKVPHSNLPRRATSDIVPCTLVFATGSASQLVRGLVKKASLLVGDGRKIGIVLQGLCKMCDWSVLNALI